MMPWLTPLVAEIRACGQSAQQIEALVERAAELAAICAQYVPQAPKLECNLDVEDQMLEITWNSARLSRALTVVAELDGTTILLLLDTSIVPGKAAGKREFTSEQLKMSVTSFFDGWTPPS